MLNDQQIQRAGDGSNLIQANTVNVFNSGIDENRARQIVDEKLQEVMNGYSEESRKIAENRVNSFANNLIPKLVRDNLLECLTDPSIQILLTETQKTAASTEREKDYNLLSELLIHRVKKGNDRYIRSGVNRAIKIVDEISDEALLGLTVAHSVIMLNPISNDLDDALKILDNLYSEIIYSDLPKGNSWIDQLDVLGAIRIKSFGSMKKIKQLYSEKLSNYTDVGIDKSSGDYTKVLNIIANSNLPKDIIKAHELREGFIRLSIDIRQINDVMINKKQQIIKDGKIFVKNHTEKLSEIQKQAIHDIYNMYINDDNLKNENITVFMKKWDGYKYLLLLREWWDSIEGSFEISSVGRVLAHANAQRCDNNIPSLF